MIANVKKRPTGDYTYVIGNVDTVQLRTYYVEWEKAYKDQEEGINYPAVLNYYQIANPPGFEADFAVYTVWARNPADVDIPASVIGSVPTDVSGLADVSNYLAGLPQFNGIFIRSSRITVQCDFADGSTARFTRTLPNSTGGSQWHIVAFSAFDEYGEPIEVNDDNSTNTVTNSSSSGITGVGSTGNSMNSSVSVYGPVVNIGGAVSITTITVGEGEEAHEVICINHVCIGT